MKTTKTIKNRTHKLSHFKIPINIPFSFIILTLAALSVTLLSFILQPNNLMDFIGYIKVTPAIFIYNLIPVLLLILLFYFLSDHVWIGVLLGSFLITALSIVNRYKIIYRDDPLVPMDLTVGKEVLSIMNKSKMEIDFKYILLLIFIVIICSALIFFTKRKKLWLPLRIGGVVICLILAFISNKEIYASKTIYEQIPVHGQRFLVSNNFNSKGFIYCFAYNFSAYTVDKPKGYSAKQVTKWISDYATPAVVPVKSPHIIMVMGEAFADISDNKNLSFTEAEDPLRFYKSLKSENLVNGYVITPAFGGGTANTEFDVLTGCITNNISESTTSSYRLVRKNFAALPRELEKLNYATLAIHPGFSWFYNRQNVFNFFGFDRTIFEDQFSKENMKGNFISEEETVDRVISEFQTHIDSGSEQPLFEFCVTIQNHMPYADYKYEGDNQPTFQTDLTLTPEAEGFLANYFIGVKDADAGIETLINYFKTIDEPVILVYYGDHLPNLGQDYLAYREIGSNVNPNGTTEEQLNIYKTPFFIWGNTSAKAYVDTSTLALPKNQTISTNYLGAMVMELIGQGDISPFFSFVNQTRKALPIITKYNFMVDDTYTTTLAPANQSQFDQYKKWQYFKMTDEITK